MKYIYKKISNIFNLTSTKFIILYIQLYFEINPFIFFIKCITQFLNAYKELTPKMHYFLHHILKILSNSFCFIFQYIFFKTRHFILNIFSISSSKLCYFEENNPLGFFYLYQTSTKLFLKLMFYIVRVAILCRSI